MVFKENQSGLLCQVDWGAVETGKEKESGVGVQKKKGYSYQARSWKHETPNLRTR